VNARAWQPAE